MNKNRNRNVDASGETFGEAMLMALLLFAGFFIIFGLAIVIVPYM